MEQDRQNQVICADAYWIKLCRTEHPADPSSEINYSHYWRIPFWLCWTSVDYKNQSLDSEVRIPKRQLESAANSWFKKSILFPIRWISVRVSWSRISAELTATLSGVRLVWLAFNCLWLRNYSRNQAHESQLTYKALGQTYADTSTPASLMDLNPPLTSITFSNPRDFKMEAAIIDRYPPAQ